MPRQNRGATLEWREERKVWEIVWFQNGRRRRRSTGASDRKQAEEHYALFLLDRQRDAVADRPADPSERAIAAILAAYGAEHAEHLTSASVVGYNIDALLKFWGNKNVANITLENCKLYARSRTRPAANGKTIAIKSGTIRRELGVLQTAINHDFKRGRLSRTVYVWRPNGSAAKDRWMTRSEAARLLRSAKARTRRDPDTGRSLEHRAHRWLPLFIIMGLYTAARKEAILTLRWHQVNLSSRVIDFNVPGREKSNKRRARIPIPDRLYTFLRIASRSATPTSFVVSRKGKPVGDIKKSFRRIADDAGLSDVTPHTLRHTAATWMTQAKVEFGIIGRYLGHSKTSTTESIYAHHHPDFLRDASEALDHRGSLRKINVLTVPITAPTLKFDPLKTIISPWNIMVGATGIEPVTPTMSKLDNNNNVISFKDLRVHKKHEKLR